MVFSKSTTSAIYGTGSDTIRASKIRDGKWLAVGGFSVTTLGKLNRIRRGVEGGVDQCGRRPHMGAEGPPARKVSVPPQGLEGEPRSGSNF